MTSIDKKAEGKRTYIQEMPVIATDKARGPHAWISCGAVNFWVCMYCKKIVLKGKRKPKENCVAKDRKP